jgi:hypothetical protein
MLEMRNMKLRGSGEMKLNLNEDPDAMALTIS